MGAQVVAQGKALNPIVHIGDFRPRARCRVSDARGRCSVQAALPHSLEHRADHPGAARRGVHQGDVHLVNLDARQAAREEVLY
jgi:hypothetical protein